MSVLLDLPVKHPVGLRLYEKYSKWVNGRWGRSKGKKLFFHRETR